MKKIKNLFLIILIIPLACYASETADVTVGNVESIKEKTININWNSLTFTYNVEKDYIWNENTHKYDLQIKKYWSKTSNTIKITNNTEKNVSIITKVTNNLNDVNIEASNKNLSIAPNDFKEINLKISGSLLPKYNNVSAGKITFEIGEID